MVGFGCCCCCLLNRNKAISADKFNDVKNIKNADIMKLIFVVEMRLCLIKPPSSTHAHTT